MTTPTEDQFQEEIHRIFRELAGAVLPDAAVAGIHSYGYLEDDDRTYYMLVDLADGHTAAICVCPGERITCRVVT